MSQSDTSPQPPVSQAGPAAWLGTILVIVGLILVFNLLFTRATPWPALNQLLAAVLALAVILTFLVLVSLSTFVRKSVRELRAKISYPLEPEARRLSLDDPDLPSAIRDPLNAPTESLIRLGYTDFGLVRLDDVGMLGMRGYSRQFYDRKTRTVARTIFSHSPGRPGQCLFAFQTRFSDGRVYSTVHTSARDMARSVLARQRGRTSRVFFDIDDLARLSRLHTAGVERLMSVHPANPVGAEAIDAVRYQLDLVRSEIEMRVASREFELDDVRGVYRPSRWGALRMALKLLPPVAAYRVHAARRRAERFVRETGH